MYIRFPIILALNKADCRGDTDNNILNIMKRYNKDNLDRSSKDYLKVRDMVVISAASECFLKKLAQQRYIHYERGDRLFLTRDDEVEMKGTSVCTNAWTYYSYYDTAHYSFIVFYIFTIT